MQSEFLRQILTVNSVQIYNTHLITIHDFVHFIILNINLQYLYSGKVKSNHVSFRHQEQLDGRSINNRFDNSLNTFFRVLFQKFFNVFNRTGFLSRILKKKNKIIYPNITKRITAHENNKCISIRMGCSFSMRRSSCGIFHNIW